MGDTRKRYRTEARPCKPVEQLSGINNAPTETKELDDLPVDIALLITLLEKYDKAQQEENTCRTEQLRAWSRCEEKRLDMSSKNDERYYEITLKKLDFQKHVFDRISLIGGVTILFLFTISTIAIYRGDFDVGFRVLGYIGTSVSLILGGISLERIRQRNRNSNNNKSGLPGGQ